MKAVVLVICTNSKIFHASYNGHGYKMFYPSIHREYCSKKKKSNPQGITHESYNPRVQAARKSILKVIWIAFQRQKKKKMKKKSHFIIQDHPGFPSITLLNLFPFLFKFLVLNLIVLEKDKIIHFSLVNIIHIFKFN